MPEELDKYTKMSDEEFIEALKKEEAENTDSGSNTEEVVVENNQQENTVEQQSQEPEQQNNTDNQNQENSSTEEKTENNVNPEENKEAVINYEAEYKKVMAPFKANGKTIELKSVDEVIKLMQQGANFTKKMQSLAPYRKLMLMLEKNNLLDENKISYLIDLDKKNPLAINKLLKDSGIDPLDINLDNPEEYKTNTNNFVSNQEVAFKSTLQDIQSTPNGNETIGLINSWDDTSKGYLWEHPEIMSYIHDQKQSGVYDRIVAEIDRRKMLGYIQNDLPFLQSYYLVGEDLKKELIQRQQQSTPIATKVVQNTNSGYSNNIQAKAASVHKPNSSSTKREYSLDELCAMSDEDFFKACPDL